MYVVVFVAAVFFFVFWVGSKLSTNIFSRHFLLTSPDKVCMYFIHLRHLHF